MDQRQHRIMSFPTIPGPSLFPDAKRATCENDRAQFGRYLAKRTDTYFNDNLIFLLEELLSNLDQDDIWPDILATALKRRNSALALKLIIAQLKNKARDLARDDLLIGA